MNRRPTLACLTVIAAAFAAGCGSPSPQEYAREANAICGQIQRDLQAVNQGGQTTDPSEINRRTQRAVDAFQRGVDRIEDLDRPSGEEGRRAEQFTQAFETFLTDKYRPGVQRLQRAVTRRNRAAIRRAAQALRNIDTSEVNRLAEQLNVRECASGG